MKKAIVLVLALVLTLSLAVPAAADVMNPPEATNPPEVVPPDFVSPAAPENSQTTAAPLPVVVESEPKRAKGSIVIVTLVDANKQKLEKDENDAMAKAQQILDEGAKGMKTTLNFVYARVIKIYGNGTTTREAVGSVTIKTENPEDIIVRQYIGDKWIDLEVVPNPNGTVTINGIQNGPMLIGTK